MRAGLFVCALRCFGLFDCVINSVFVCLIVFVVRLVWLFGLCVCLFGLFVWLVWLRCACPIVSLCWRVCLFGWNVGLLGCLRVCLFGSGCVQTWLIGGLAVCLFGWFGLLACCVGCVGCRASVCVRLFGRCAQLVGWFS